MKVVYIAGPAGVGKTTVANLLKENNNFTVLQVGVELRNIAKTNTKVADCIRNALPVSESILGPLRTEFFLKNKSKIIVVEGHLMNDEQLISHNKLIAKYQPDYLSIILDTSDKVIIQRMKKRGRIDDTEKLISQKLDDFRKNIFPRFENMLNFPGHIFIDAKQKPEEIYKEIIFHVNNKFKNQSS